MTDNDPAATAALAERVADLDRLFPRREETTGRAMCAGWGPTTVGRTIVSDAYVTVPTTPQARCTAELESKRQLYRCSLPKGHGGSHDDQRLNHCWGELAKPKTVRRDVASVTT